MAFPINRPRRLRRTETLRRMIRETRLSPDDLIQPFFVCPGRDVKRPISSMPGVAQMSVDQVLRELKPDEIEKAKAEALAYTFKTK